MGSRKKNTPLKAVDIIGHDIDPRYNNKHTVTIGNKKTGTSFEEIKAKLTGNIAKDTIISISMHGNIYQDGDHIVYIQEDQPAFTSGLLDLIQSCAPQTPLQIDLSSCHSGRAKADTKYLYPGSVLTTNSKEDKEALFVLDAMKYSTAFSKYALEKNPYARFLKMIPLKAATYSIFSSGSDYFEMNPTHNVLLSPEDAKKFLQSESKKFIKFARSKTWNNKPVKIKATELSKEKIDIFTKSFFAHECANNKDFSKFLEKNLNTNEYLQEAAKYKFDDGSTALYLASGSGHSETVKELLKAGADANSNILSGESALHLASQEGYTQIVKLLLKAGAETGVNRGSDGGTPLSIASYRGDKDIVNALLKAGANPDSSFVDGKTSLLVAAYNGHTKIVQLLLKYGANPDKTWAGHSPLDLAKSMRHFDIARVLHKYIIEHHTSEEQFSYEIQQEVLGDHNLASDEL